MPTSAWILLGALAALIAKTPGATTATIHAITATTTWTLTHPSGLALIATLALWHLTTHHLRPAARRHAHH